MITAAGKKEVFTILPATARATTHNSRLRIGGR
jgi:hypothetical protein